MKSNLEFRKTADKRLCTEWHVFEITENDFYETEETHIAVIHYFKKKFSFNIVAKVENLDYIRQIADFCEQQTSKEDDIVKITYMNLWHCPKCGGHTDTFRHLYAEVWCTDCGFVLRKEGDQTIVHKVEQQTKEKA